MQNDWWEDGRCRYCGEPTRPAPTARFAWSYRFESICRSHRCRTFDAYYHRCLRDFGRSYPKMSKYYGPYIMLYEMAEFLRRMAKPQSPRDREFAKRFPHMKTTRG